MTVQSDVLKLRAILDTTSLDSSILKSMRSTESWINRFTKFRTELGKLTGVQRKNLNALTRSQEAINSKVREENAARRLALQAQQAQLTASRQQAKANAAAAAASSSMANAVNGGRTGGGSGGGSNNNQKARNAGGAGRFNGLSDFGFAGLGVGYALSSILGPTAELESIIDRISGARREFRGQEIQDRIYNSVRQSTLGDSESGRPSPVSSVEFAESFLKIVKDGIGVVDTLTEEINARLASGKITKAKADSLKSIDSSFELIEQLTNSAANIARAVGEPDKTSEIADVIGEIIPKTVTNFEELEETERLLQNFERTVVGTLFSTRFDVGNLTKALRNTIGTDSFTDLPVDEVLKLFTALDRVAPTGRSVGTSLRRLVQELSPSSKLDNQIIASAGYKDVATFQKKVSGLKTAREFINLLTDFHTRLEKANPDFAASYGKRFFGSEGDKAFRGIIKSGLASFNELEERIANIDVGESIAVVETNFKAALAGFSNSFRSLMNTIGFTGGLLNSLTATFDSIGMSVKQLAIFSEANPMLAKFLAGMIKFVAIFFPLTVLLLGLSFVFSKVATSIGTLYALIAGFVMILNQLTGGFLGLAFDWLIFSPIIWALKKFVQTIEWVGGILDSMSLAGDIIQIVLSLGVLVGALYLFGAAITAIASTAAMGTAIAGAGMATSAVVGVASLMTPSAIGLLGYAHFSTPIMKFANFIKGVFNFLVGGKLKLAHKIFLGIVGVFSLFTDYLGTFYNWILETLGIRTPSPGGGIVGDDDEDRKKRPPVVIKDLSFLERFDNALKRAMGVEEKYLHAFDSTDPSMTKEKFDAALESRALAEEEIRLQEEKLQGLRDANEFQMLHNEQILDASKKLKELQDEFEKFGDRIRGI